MFWQGTGGRKWVKKVQQEWGILEKNLPGLLLLNIQTLKMAKDNNFMVCWCSFHCNCRLYLCQGIWRSHGSHKSRDYWSKWNTLPRWSVLLWFPHSTWVPASSSGNCNIIMSSCYALSWFTYKSCKWTHLSDFAGIAAFFICVVNCAVSILSFWWFACKPKPVRGREGLLKPLK